MDICIGISPNYIKENTQINGKIIEGYEDEQILFSIGKYSYIINSILDNEHSHIIIYERSVHNLQIGQFCSIAPECLFITGRNHNYKNVTTGVCNLLDSNTHNFYGFRHKGSIIIQNDVWIGRNSTIMPGIVIRNGAVVAANSHVVKDVPPYAIVGGNPAQVIGYRFEDDIIEMLQEIRWWNWDAEKISRYSHYFSMGARKFCDIVYPGTINQKKDINISKKENLFVYFMDFDDFYPCYIFVIDEFLIEFKERGTYELLLYIFPEDLKKHDHTIKELDAILDIELTKKFKISIEFVKDGRDPEELIAQADYYITNRRKETVLFTEYSDKYNTKMVSGVDMPIFSGLHL